MKTHLLKLLKWSSMTFLALFVLFSAPLNLITQHHFAAAADAPASTVGTSVDAESKIVLVLCKVSSLLTGTVGKAIAILIVISLALGLFFAKVTWGMAIATGVGMGILFGANSLVTFISGTTTDPCASIQGN